MDSKTSNLIKVYIRRVYKEYIRFNDPPHSINLQKVSLNCSLHLSVKLPHMQRFLVSQSVLYPPSFAGLAPELGATVTGSAGGVQVT